MALGGTRPGAGRKSNASKLLAAGFVASWFTSEFQEIKWKSFLESDDEKIRLDATKYLTDRIYGKATQALEHTGPDGGPIPIATITAADLTDEHLAALITGAKE